MAVRISAAPLWSGDKRHADQQLERPRETGRSRPPTGQTVAFNGNTSQMTVTVDAPAAGGSYAGISFGPAPGSYTLTGSGLTMTADIINFSPSPQTIDLPLAVDAKCQRHRPERPGRAPSPPPPTARSTTAATP